MSHASALTLAARYVLVLALASLLSFGCQSPTVVTPTQAAGTHNFQQTGGVHADGRVTVAPVINVPVESPDSPANVNQQPRQQNATTPAPVPAAPAPPSSQPSADTSPSPWVGPSVVPA